MSGALVASVAIALAACSSSTSSPGGGPARGSGFAALDGLQLPGTSEGNWEKLMETNGQPMPAIDMDTASSTDTLFVVAFFNFFSVADAASFYANPPARIQGFIEQALGYAPLAGSTGIADPSKGFDLRTCTGLGSGPALLPSGQCSDGSASFSIGVGTIVQRGSVDFFIGYLVGEKHDHGDPSNLAKLTPYAQDALHALASVGLPS
jgi:hypothetical protein